MEKFVCLFMKKAFIILFFIMILSISFVYSVDCPRGLVNDEYPGICNLYSDSDNDEICDLSQESVTEEISEKEINPEFNSSVQTSKGINYNFLLISIIILILYVVSFVLSKKEIISKVFHRKIWNILLLISFLGVGISGILLVLRLSYGININLGFNLLFIHVETGIIMTIISIFHIIWHYPYFKSLLKR